MRKKGIISTILLFLSFSFGATIGIGTSQGHNTDSVFSIEQYVKSIDSKGVICVENELKSIDTQEAYTYGPYEIGEITVVAENLSHNKKCVDSDTGDEPRCLSIEVSELSTPIALLEVDELQVPDKIKLT